MILLFSQTNSQRICRVALPKRSGYNIANMFYNDNIQSIQQRQKLMWDSGWWIYAWGDPNSNKDKTITRDLVMRVLYYARPYWRHIGAMLVLILISTVLGLLTPLIFRDLIDHALPNGDAGRLNVLALGLVILPVLISVVGVGTRRINAWVGESVIYDLRTSLYKHMQKMSLRFFTNTKAGELMSRLNNDVVSAHSAISDTITSFIVNLFQVVLTLGVMLTLEWRLTLLGMVVFPFFVLVARNIGNKLRELRREGMEHNAHMNAMMNETLNISGALLVKLFGRTQMEGDRFAQRAARVRDVGVREAVLGDGFWLFIGLLGVFGTALVYWVGGYMVLQGSFTIGTIVAFSAFLTQLYGPLQSLTNTPVSFARSMVSFERVFEVLDLPVEIAERPNAQAVSAVRGDLTFESVSFNYNAAPALSDVYRPGHMSSVTAVLSSESGADDHAAAKEGAQTSQAREMALADLDIHIRAGQLVALVGPSGAGKTTTTYLIPRLYDPTTGRILLDGVDLRELSLDSLAQHIGMVTQETYLFHDTIKTNLLYAKRDATMDEIEAACRAANIHDFIAAMPQGYDTVVGERGYRLSGGEKQRIAIARVILKNPKILVLDEATSHLDSQSEALIQAALQTVMQGRTSIVIAHRLSTILSADVILVMDKGRIAERGTHASLLAQGGLYAALYETQFRAQQAAAQQTAAHAEPTLA
jgi:ATP-binding cassette, subfamily B, bacterial